MIQIFKGIKIETDPLYKSWSSDLMSKHPNSHWITMNGNRVLIAGQSDGSARVVFAGNAALEHLTLEKRDTESNNNAHTTSENETKESISGDTLQKLNQLRKEKIESQNVVRETFLNKLDEITGINLSNKEESKKKKGENKDIDKLNDSIDDLSKKDKKKVEKAIEQIATAKATNGVLEDTLGSSYADLFGETALKTGIEHIDKQLENLQLTPEQALQILNSSNQYKQQMNDLDKAYKSAFKKPEKTIKAIEDIKELGINDIFEPTELVNTAIDSLLEQKATQQRVENNLNFYELAEKNLNKETSKLQHDGAKETFNSILQLSGKELKISKDLVSILGIKNAAKIIASQLSNEDVSLLQKYVENKQSGLIQDTLDKTNQTLKDIAQLQNKTEAGTIYEATAGLQIARARRELAKDLSIAAGSLNSSAEIINAHFQKDKNVSINIDKKDLKDVLEKLKANNIDLSNVAVFDNGNRFDLTFKPETFEDILIKQKSKAQRDEFTQKLKNGELIQANWKPAFANQMALPAQQEGIKWALNQKRTILDFGAGLGKTFTYLGIVGELKQQDKLNDSFAVMAVPSRLKKEFYGDKNKYYPDLNMLNLDDVDNSLSLKNRIKLFPNIPENELKNAGTMQLKQFAITAAKNGEYDILLTGHDTMKNPETVKLLASNKPAAFIVDEAHESINAESMNKAEGMLRQKAVTDIGKNSEYFTAGTGTLVKNNLMELGKLINIANPNTVSNPEAYAKKWNAKINKNSTLFHNNTMNEFRKTYDNVILSRSSDVSYFDSKGNKKEPVLIHNEIKMDISPEQKAKYEKINKLYQQEKLNKGKFGILDNKTGLFVEAGDNIVAYDKRPNLAKLGHNKKDYSTVELGGAEATNRRELNQKKNLYAGDYKTNAKVQKVFENIQSNPDQKHIVYYDTSITKEAKKTLLAGLKEQLKLTDADIAEIDGSVKIGADRNGQKDKFNTGSAKVILMNSAGATGLNLQSADIIHVLSRPNTYAEQTQLAARAYRKGREKDVNINYYDSNTDFDAKKVQTIKNKKKIFEATGEYQENPTMQKLISNLK